MDYSSFRGRDVVAYFSENRNTLCVQGELDGKHEEELVFKNANVDIINNGKLFTSGDYLESKNGRLLKESFPLASFKESKLIGICRVK